MAARLVVLGRQGAGKGTQCERLAARLGIPHLSTGDLFRSEILAETPLGAEIDHYVSRGELVPDEVVIDVVARQLGDRGRRASGCLLDGFPRTLNQGQAFFEVLGERAVDLAIEIDVPTYVVLPRLAARRVCLSCSTVGTAAADELSACGQCGGEMTRRPDDQPDAIVRRLALYDEQAGPLLVWLDSRGLLERVDGVGTPDDVQQRLLRAVASRIELPLSARQQLQL